MKKPFIILVSALMIVGFFLLVRQAYMSRRGGPVEVASPSQKMVLQVPYRNAGIDLAKADYNPSPWEGLKGVDLRLSYQVTVIPWGGSLIRDLNVTSFHNGRTVYFKLRYNDVTRNDSVTMSQFTDSASILFPLDERGVVKPESIMMGAQGKVNIWHWRAFEDREYWSKKQKRGEGSEIFSPVSDLNATGIGTLTPKKEQRVTGRGYKTGTGWEIIFSRDLSVMVPGEDASFETGKRYLSAYAVWDGEQEDRGPRKSISDYIEFIIEKAP